ncbi:MAG: amidase [Alphaproteobacteria bacterium]|nr:MAG: amidase [Alphaproteobacteria bacterium]
MSVRDRLDQALARIADPKGEGARACLTVYADAARAAADAADARAKSGISLGCLDGAIVTVKDLFDVAGEPTRAGSRIMADAPSASADAPVVRRLRAAGAVIVAKTNMTEFAFSGVGMNPHYGTPGNPAERARVPGGSSSGAAVAAADRMCEIAIGTDTGGSTRIPAALCGIVGFKPSQWRVPTEGAFPLSYMLDSIGPLARSVADCANADAVMAGEDFAALEPAPVAGLRLGIPQGMLLKDFDNTVGTRFGAAKKTLTDAGVRLTDQPMPLFDAMLAVNAKGGFAPAEAYSIHRDNLARRANEFDPNVRARIERGAKLSAADYVEMARERARLVRAMDAQLAGLDALALPTTPITAPTIAEMEDTHTFNANNMLLLRNTSAWNFFDMCAISIPIPGAGLPVGLMLVARNGHDRRLFDLAAGIERLFAA